MDGLKEALQYIVGLNEPHYISDDQGRVIADKKMYRVDETASVEAVKLSTLDSLIDYLRNDMGDERPECMYVHVKSPTEVILMAPVQKVEDYKRNIFVQVKADLPEFPFGQFMDSETFIIKLKSMFMDQFSEASCSGKEEVLRYAGNVQHGTLQTDIDDGVSQHAEIKTGILQTDMVSAPSIVYLRPYRTFLEVDQPESAFLFRIRDERGDGISCALFEADGNMWKYTAKHNVAAYLKEKLDGMDNIVILS